MTITERTKYIVRIRRRFSCHYLQIFQLVSQNAQNYNKFHTSTFQFDFKVLV